MKKSGKTKQKEYTASGGWSAEGEVPGVIHVEDGRLGRSCLKLGPVKDGLDGRNLWLRLGVSGDWEREFSSGTQQQQVEESELS